MSEDKGLEKLGELFGRQRKKPPKYVWQELALRVITELSIPDFKRNAVFKVCKQYPRAYIEKCLIDTKELCHHGQCWRYFFKLVGSLKKKK